MVGTTPSLVMKFLVQTAYLAALEVATYSALIVESAVVSCLQLHQLTAPTFKVNPNAKADFLSSISD